MHLLSPLRLVGMIFFAATAVQLSGQSTTVSETAQAARASSAPPTTATTVQAFHQEQLTLAREERALESSGATSQQIEAWRTQNASAFALQQERMQSITLAASLRLEPTNRQPRLPPNASHAVETFLTSQVALANARAAIHNQLMQQYAASGQGWTLARIGQLKLEEDQLFKQQNSSLISLQVQRAQALSNASAQTVRPVPGPAVIPANATPQMAAFLTTRRQLRQEMVQFRNQYASSTPAVRDAAMKEWFAQNAGQIAQLHQEAKQLSQESTDTTN